MAKEHGNREASVSRALEYQVSYNDDGTFRWTPPAGSKELATALSYHYPEEKGMKAKMQAAIEEFLRDERKVVFRDANKGREVNATKFTIGTEHDAGFFTPRTHPILALSETARKAATTSDDKLSHKTDSKWHQAAEVGGFDLSLQTPIGIQDIAVQQNMNLEKSNLQILSWDAKESKFKGDNRRKKRRYGKLEGAKVAANRGYVCDFHRRQKAKCDPDLCPRNKLRLRNMLKLAQETPNSDILSSGIAIQKHAVTGSGSLSPLILPPKETDEQPISSYPNNVTCLTNYTSMFAKESRANPLHYAIARKASGLRDSGHKEFGQESAFNNEDLELEGDQIGTSASFNVLAPSRKIYSNDTVECRPQQISQNMWSPAHSVLFPRFMAPNLLPHASTPEPLVDVEVPLNADPPFAEGILTSHEADSANELQLPSNQSCSYIEANTELDEEIAALMQSWIKPDMTMRVPLWDESGCLKLNLATMKERYQTSFLEFERQLSPSGQPTFEWKKWKSLPYFAFAYGEYIMGRVRAFVNFLL